MAAIFLLFLNSLTTRGPAAGPYIDHVSYEGLELGPCLKLSLWKYISQDIFPIVRRFCIPIVTIRLLQLRSDVIKLLSVIEKFKNLIWPQSFRSQNTQFSCLWKVCTYFSLKLHVHQFHFSLVLKIILILLTARAYVIEETCK